MHSNYPNQSGGHPEHQGYPQAPHPPTGGGYPSATGYPQGTHPTAPGYPPATGYPQGTYPPASGYTQGTYPPASGYPQGPYPPASGYPQGPYSPASGYTQGTYPPASGYPQGPYPPASGYPQGPYPPTSGYPQGPYPPATGNPQGTYPPASGYPQGSSLTKPNQSHQGTPQGMASNGYSSPREDPMSTFDFNEKSIRLNFIRKVYSILTVQLLISAGLVSLFIFDKKVNKYFKEHNEYALIAIIVVIVLSITLACSSNIRRKTPTNFICLFVFTIAFSFLTATIAATYDVIEVLLAVGMTAAITLGLTLFAFQTRLDFTGCGGALFCLVLVFFISGIFCAIFPSRALHALYAGIGAFLMSIYIVYDTQLMLGGSHKFSISPEEYIFAALNLYLDIIYFFLYLLQFIGVRK